MRPLIIVLLLLPLLTACGKQNKAGTHSEAIEGTFSHSKVAASTETPRIEAGKLKYATVCLGCHGQNGQGQGPFRRLAGRPVAELIAQLKAYRAGTMRGPESKTMMPFAEPLTDPEIDAVAGYLAAL